MVIPLDCTACVQYYCCVPEYTRIDQREDFAVSSCRLVFVIMPVVDNANGVNTDRIQLRYYYKLFFRVCILVELSGHSTLRGCDCWELLHLLSLLLGCCLDNFVRCIIMDR